MYRRVVISADKIRSGPISVEYDVSGATVVSQRKNVNGGFDVTVPVIEQLVPNVFSNLVYLRTVSSVSDKVSFEFILDVPENQPFKESVIERTETGVSITVYNANGVLVCRNVPKTPASDPTQNVGPGEMTSEPIGGPGEMTSEPIDGPGEMTSEPIDGSGATI